METATIVVPMLPPRECSPNWRGHWTEHARAARGQLNGAQWEAFYLAGLLGDVVMDIEVSWGGGASAWTRITS